jgi:hypothetical protein
MWGVDMLFVVGGNGGNAGANAIQQVCAEQDVACSVIGVPKSIDNDILLVRARTHAVWRRRRPGGCACLLLFVALLLCLLRVG